MYNYRLQQADRATASNAFLKGSKYDLGGMMLFYILVAALAAVILYSCKKDYSCETCYSNNKPPIASAGSPQIVYLPTDTVLLNGSSSKDPDGVISAWRWRKIAGPSTFHIVHADSSKTLIRFLVEGVYRFELKVTDNNNVVARDTVQVTVIDSELTNTANAEVYIAGGDYRAKYWKNGEVLSLGSTAGEALARSIVVVGSDVYTAGEEGDFFMYGSNRAKYWKNGNEVFLTGPTGAGATSIAVVGIDIHVVGWELNANRRPVAKYWKNGREIPLTFGTKDSEANAVVVNGNDVYVAGYEGLTAMYWINGHPIALTDGSNQARANAIAVDGNDIYVAGSEFVGSRMVAKYWKNGQAVSLVNGIENSEATSIAVRNGVAYVCGWEGGYIGRVGDKGSVAKVWINGQAVSLTTGLTFAYATGIALFNNDVYVSGYENNGSTTISRYWKNGRATTLSEGYFALGITVVPR